MGNIARHLLLLLLFIAAAFAERPGDFKVVGPGGGGAMFNPTVSPHDPKTVLISCDMTGSYITHDGGQSWRMFNLRGTVRFFVFDPLDPKVMYAQVTGLWRSTDAGETWNLIYPKPDAIRSIEMRSDHSDENLVADPNPLGDIAALAIDPKDSKTLYAAAGDKSHASLFVSHDWGENWTKQDDLPETPRRIWADPNSPAESRAIYISGPKFFVLKDSAGIHKFPVPESVTFTDVSLGFTPAPIVYAVSEKGVLISKDGGKTWSQASF